MKETIPMNLAYWLPPQANNGNKQALMMTAMNLYAYELKKAFPENIHDIKTEFIPIIFIAEEEGTTKEAKTILQKGSRCGYNFLIKFNADIEKFKEILSWHSNKLKTSDINSNIIKAFMRRAS